MASRKRRAPQLSNHVSHSKIQPPRKRKPTNQLTLLSLPPEIIQQIIGYLHPVPEYFKVASDSCTKLLPLALTCRQMFSHVSSVIATFFEYDQYEPLFPRIEQDVMSNPYRKSLLMTSALIAINRLKPLNQQLPSTFQSRRMSTRSMTQGAIRIVHSEIDAEEIRSKKTSCRINAPLFDMKAHTTTCRHHLAWFVIAASSGSLSHFPFDAMLPRRNSGGYCILRMCTLIKPIFKKAMLSLPSDATTTKGQPVLDMFFQNCTKDMQELEITLSNVRYVKALSQTSMSNLKSICFSEEIASVWFHNRDTITTVLGTLTANGSKLTAISMHRRVFAISKKQDNPIDLDSLAPHARQLTIVGWNAENNNYMLQTFEKCQNIENLTFEEREIDLQKFFDARHKGVLPRLNSIRFQFISVLRFPLTLGFNNEYEKTARLIKEFDLFDRITEDNLAVLEKYFSFLPTMNLAILPHLIPNLCSYIKTMTNLKDLSLTLIETDSNFLYPDLFLYYSKRFAMSVNRRLSTLERIYVRNICVSVADGIKMLRKMGPRAKQFSWPMCESETYIDDECPVVACITPGSAIRVLDTVVEYCPNIEKLSIFPPDIDMVELDWSDYDLELVNQAVVSAATKLKHLNPRTFFIN